MDPFSLDISEFDPSLDDDGFFDCVFRKRVTTWPKIAQQPPAKFSQDVPQAQQRTNISIAKPAEQPAVMNNVKFSAGSPPGSTRITPERSVSQIDAAEITRKPSARMNPWGPQTYTDLISQAIAAAPGNRLKLPEIYSWISHNVPYFSDKDGVGNANWKNSVRHTLSLASSPFSREQDPRLGKSSWWSLASQDKPTANKHKADDAPSHYRRRAKTDSDDMEKHRRSALEKVKEARKARKSPPARSPSRVALDFNAFGEYYSSFDGSAIPADYPPEAGFNIQRRYSETNISAESSDSGVSSVFTLSGNGISHHASDDDEMNDLLAEALKIADQVDDSGVHFSSHQGQANGFEPAIDTSQMKHFQQPRVTPHRQFSGGSRPVTPQRQFSAGSENKPGQLKAQAQYEMTGMSGNLVYLKRTAAAAAAGGNQHLTPEFLVWDVQRNTYNLPEDQLRAGILLNPEDEKQPLLWQTNQPLNTIVEGVAMETPLKAAVNGFHTPPNEHGPLHHAQPSQQAGHDGQTLESFISQPNHDSTTTLSSVTADCPVDHSTSNVVMQDLNSPPTPGEPQSITMEDLEIGPDGLDFVRAICGLDSPGFEFCFDSEGNISF